MMTFPPKQSYNEVDEYASLPLASDSTNRIYVVKNASGSVFLLNKKNAGLYYSNGVTWNFMGNSVKIDDSTASSESTYSSNKIMAVVASVGGSLHAQNVAEIEGMFKTAYATMYTEYDYSDVSVSTIRVYTDSGKGTAVFTKSITYSSGRVSSTDLLDIGSGYRVVTTYVYDGTGTITSKSKAVTQG